MKTMLMSAFRERDGEIWRVGLLFVILVLMWPMVQQLLHGADVTVGYVDPSILVLIVLSLICFLGLIGLCWWLMQRFLLVYELPGIGGLVSRFDELVLWQQLRFYLGLFALLLLSAVGCLAAVL